MLPSADHVVSSAEQAATEDDMQFPESILDSPRERLNVSQRDRLVKPLVEGFPQGPKEQPNHSMSEKCKMRALNIILEVMAKTLVWILCRKPPSKKSEIMQEHRGRQWSAISSSVYWPLRVWRDRVLQDAPHLPHDRHQHG